MAFYESVAAVQERQAQGEAFLHWDIKLPPHIEPERLELNTKLLAGIGRVAGFGGIHLDEYVGEQTAFEAPAIGGMFGDGTAAAAGAGKVAKVKSETSSLRGLRNDLPRHYQWPTAHVAINRPEMVSRIATRTTEGREDHQAWASELNGCLQRGLRNAAKQNLIPPSDFWDKYTGAVVGFSLFSITTPPSTPLGVSLSAGVLLFVHGAELAREKQDHLNLTDRRWSLFANGSVQLDRYAAVSLLTTLPLVRSQPSTNR